MFQVLGDIAKADLGRPLDYFKERGVLLDCRGGLIIHPTAAIGYEVKVITQSHDMLSWGSGPVVDRPVTIEANAFVGSFSILYNCSIGEGSIVSIGSVVRSVVIPSGVIVEGNPVRIIAIRQRDGTWYYLEPPRTETEDPMCSVLVTRR